MPCISVKLSVLCHTFQTPDGKVKLAHWEELLKAENNRFRLRVSYKLTEARLWPKSYQKMNVTLAYQVCVCTIVILSLYRVIQLISQL
jgi:hypothetical protein